MPALLVEAQRVAHTVTHGTHGRRRAGPGETFWQFRHFDHNDSQGGIDWRRSASSDHLFVREREWEAAHTVWLWVDLSPSMKFRSRLSPTLKESRAVVLALALSELLARGGERVGVLGTLAVHWPERRTARRRGSGAQCRRQGAKPAATGAAQPLLRVPVVQRFSRARGGDQRKARGHRRPGRARSSRPDPRSRRGDAALRRPHRVCRERRPGPRHRRPRRELARAATRSVSPTIAPRSPPWRDASTWSFVVHHTDRPAEEVVLAIHNRLAGLERDYRYRPPVAKASGEIAAGKRCMMSLGAIGFLQPWILLGLAALPAIWWLLRLTPPTPHHVVFPPTRLLKDLKSTEETPAHSPWWLTALRMLLAALIVFALARPGAQSRSGRASPAPVLCFSSSTMAGPRPPIGPSGARPSTRQSTGPRGTAAPWCWRRRRPASRSPDRVAAEQAQERAAGLGPKPYDPDRKALAETLERELGGKTDFSVVWLSDGLDYGEGSSFAEALAKLAGTSGSRDRASPRGRQRGARPRPKPPATAAASSPAS